MEELTKEQQDELNKLAVAMAEEAISVRLDYEENGSELEQPLAIARDIKKLNDNLAFYDENLTIDIFL